MSGKYTPQLRSDRRAANNLSQIRQTQLTGVSSTSNVLNSLRATQIVASKPVLPAELIALILDYLPVQELLSSARVSRRLQEMVYDDSRWIQKLKAIGIWNENEARQRVEDAMKKKMNSQVSKDSGEVNGEPGNAGGHVHTMGNTRRQHAGSETIFDAGVETERYQKSLDLSQRPAAVRRGRLSDGFDELTMSTSTPAQVSGQPRHPDVALNVLVRVRSIRGYARQEFGRVYDALGPLYFDLARSKSHSDATVFRTYRDPEQQAQILSSLKRFARCDSSLGWQDRERKLDTMIDVFESAVLREFEQGYTADDVVRMCRYAHVLVALNDGSAVVEYFVSNNSVLTHNTRLGNPLDCIEAVAPGHVDLSPSQAFFEDLARNIDEQADVIDKVFPAFIDVLTPLVSRLCAEILADYLTALFDEAHQKGIETYVKAVSGTFGQALRFVASIRPTKASPVDFQERTIQMVTSCYEKHIDLYLAEELAVFATKSDSEVTHWEKELSEQEASTESFFMSNFNRQAAKRDFLSSFKKVVMMPVNVLPAFGTTAKAPVNKSVIASAGTSETSSTTIGAGSPTSNEIGTPQRPGTPQLEPPTTELAAKAAVMKSRLEGIRSLFSIEVALNLTHLAKACIERAALLVRMGGQHGEEAREQCETIFVMLIQVLGDRHIKNGFNKAVGHLSKYNPRQVRELREQATHAAHHNTYGTAGVEPLVTFLELVNVGDLIQQMVDVFFAQELVATKLTDRDDFLNPAVKEKKRFEQMLDERVAAGLNRGIDVLMDEIEFICATTQLPTDFNPSATSSTKLGISAIVDVGASKTAIEVVEMVSSHTSMLVGSTDKNMLDVFMQEVGLRLFGVLCKHFKRQRISVDGSIKLISDINHYSSFVASLRQKSLSPYYQALREMSQLYLVQIDPPAAYFGTNAKGNRASLLSSKGSRTATQTKELATIISDADRYHGTFPTEEVYEFAERRADWYLVKGDVEKAMYGVGCSVM